MILKNLQKLGFSKNEAKVYLALLKMGFCTTGPIIKKTSLHRNIVYETLDKLVARGLVSQTIQRGKKHFRPLSPEKILKQEKSQLDLAGKVVPELIKLQKQEKQEVIVYEGIEGFQNAHLDAIEQMKKNSTIYVLIAGAKKWFDNIKPSLKKFDKIRVSKKIKIKITALESQRQDMQVQQKRTLFGIRFLSQKFDNPADTAIYGDTALIIVYGEPVFIIMIKNPRIAKSFKQYFNIFWKIAKK
ncbi:hypothetical protein CL633_00680 [bacterium]|nr:hypothetical protein [bacterium]|tara:strand:+ start:1049 stop:1777 length:729 start_codon:yes stop_codon:yes gene_type:complete